MEMVKATAAKANPTQSVVKFIVGVAAIVVMIAISAMTVVKTNQAVSASSANTTESTQVVASK